MCGRCSLRPRPDQVEWDWLIGITASSGVQKKRRESDAPGGRMDRDRMWSARRGAVCSAVRRNSSRDRHPRRKDLVSGPRDLQHTRDHAGVGGTLHGAGAEDAGHALTIARNTEKASPLWTTQHTAIVNILGTAALAPVTDPDALGAEFTRGARPVLTLLISVSWCRTPTPMGWCSGETGEKSSRFQSSVPAAPQRAGAESVPFERGSVGTCLLTKMLISVDTAASSGASP